MRFTVFIYWRLGRHTGTWPQVLHSCESAMMAELLARSVHETFGCPAWVADFHRPADVHSIKWRADSRQLLERLASGVRNDVQIADVVDAGSASAEGMRDGHAR